MDMGQKHALRQHTGKTIDQLVLHEQVALVYRLATPSLATAEIRRHKDSHGRRLPIVALTAHATESDRELCLAAGMDDYLTKPYTLSQLNAVLDRYLAVRRRP